MIKKYYWVIIAIVVLIISAVAVIWYLDTTRVNNVSKVITTTPASTSSSQASPSATKKGAVETAKLKAVGNYTGSGSATREWDDSTFTHIVIVDLDPPAEGKFYEGWLVNMSLDPPFFSTGNLSKLVGIPEKKLPGTHRLTFKAEKDYTQYTLIVITEETSANGNDNIPETHVLEGLF